LCHATRWGGFHDDAGKQSGTHGTRQFMQLVLLDDFFQALGKVLFVLVSGGVHIQFSWCCVDRMS
jgi:hypothetical protein